MLDVGPELSLQLKQSPESTARVAWPLLSHLPAESFMSISVNSWCLSRQGVAGMIPQIHPMGYSCWENLHIFTAKGNRRGMMREPRDGGA